MNAKAEKKNNGILHIAMNLTIACLISGIILSFTYYLTSGIAEKKSQELIYSSMKTLVPDADSFQKIHGKSDWYTATADKKTIAYIVSSTSRGYSGTIELLVAVSPQEKILNFEVTSSDETPGLGDKATKEPFIGQFKGKSSDEMVVVKDPSDKAHIQAVTGATISSRAVTRGVKTAVAEVKAMLGGN